MKLQFQQGDIIFINSNDLHRAYETENLVMDVIMFEPSLLSIDLKFDPDLMAPFRSLGNMERQSPCTMNWLTCWGA